MANYLSLQLKADSDEATADALKTLYEAFRQGQLEGQTLGCWCQSVDESGPACHGEVIKEWVERLNHE